MASASMKDGRPDLARTSSTVYTPTSIPFMRTPGFIKSCTAIIVLFPGSFRLRSITAERERSFVFRQYSTAGEIRSGSGQD